MADRQSPQSFSFAAGEAFSLVFTVDQVITGMTPRFSAKRRSTDTAVLASGTTATATVSAPSECTVAATDENTANLLGTYSYSVEIEDGSGNKSEVAYGFLTFTPKMT